MWVREKRERESVLHPNTSELIRYVWIKHKIKIRNWKSAFIPSNTFIFQHFIVTPSTQSKSNTCLIPFFACNKIRMLLLKERNLKIQNITVDYTTLITLHQKLQDFDCNFINLKRYISKLLIMARISFWSVSIALNDNCWMELYLNHSVTLAVFYLV